MGARVILVRDIWIEGTLSQIQRGLQGYSEGKERARRLGEIADSLAALQSENPGAAEAIRAGVEKAVAVGIVTEEESRNLSTKLG